MFSIVIHIPEELDKSKLHQRLKCDLCDYESYGKRDILKIWKHKHRKNIIYNSIHS